MPASVFENVIEGIRSIVAGVESPYDVGEDAFAETYLDGELELEAAGAWAVVGIARDDAVDGQTNNKLQHTLEFFVEINFDDTIATSATDELRPLPVALRLISQTAKALMEEPRQLGGVAVPGNVLYRNLSGLRITSNDQNTGRWAIAATFAVQWRHSAADPFALS